jgi:hypothetical protein
MNCLKKIEFNFRKEQLLAKNLIILRSNFELLGPHFPENRMVNTNIGCA